MHFELVKIAVDRIRSHTHLIPAAHIYERFTQVYICSTVS